MCRIGLIATHISLGHTVSRWSHCVSLHLMSYWVSLCLSVSFCLTASHYVSLCVTSFHCISLQPNYVMLIFTVILLLTASHWDSLHLAASHSVSLHLAAPPGLAVNQFSEVAPKKKLFALSNTTFTVLCKALPTTEVSGLHTDSPV